jgi:hypothetical protein
LINVRKLGELVPSRTFHITWGVTGHASLDFDENIENKIKNIK